MYIGDKMNYEFLTILVSCVLLLITYLQYRNSKNNFLVAKLPVISVTNIEGVYDNNNLRIVIEIENNGDSSALDLLLASGIEKSNQVHYNKIDILKVGSKKNVEIIFNRSEITETLNLIEQNNKMFNKSKTNEVLLPMFVCNIYYQNIYFKFYTTSYAKPIFHFINLVDKNGKRAENIKILNFLSDNVPFFSYEKLSKREYKKVLKDYEKKLPFEFIPSKEK
jgi:hypothetical protein